MKHYRFTAREVVGWMRVCRPGSVIGPQQQYLEDIQGRMWQEGESFRRIRVLPDPALGTLATKTEADRAAAAAAAFAAPHLVTSGHMHAQAWRGNAASAAGLAAAAAAAAGNTNNNVRS